MLTLKYLGGIGESDEWNEAYATEDECGCGFDDGGSSGLGENAVAVINIETGE